MQDNTWYIISDASLGGLAYEGEAVVTVSSIEWDEIDCGIGEYEYWGSKESQNVTRMEAAEVHIESAMLYDEEGNDVYIDLKDPANKPLIEYWSNYIEEHAEYE